MTIIHRQTRETHIRLEVSPGTGSASVRTGAPFLDHMMTTLSRYAALDLSISCEGDLRHHVIEDVAITFGAAVKELIDPACQRYGDRCVPMDDALVHTSIDIGGRPYYCGRLPSALYDHWMRSFADNAGATMHVRVLRGRDRHHVVEAAFKALGFALRDALEVKGTRSIMSTKGAAKIEVQCP